MHKFKLTGFCPTALLLNSLVVCSCSPPPLLPKLARCLRLPWPGPCFPPALPPTHPPTPTHPTHSQSGCPDWYCRPATLGAEAAGGQRGGRGARLGTARWPGWGKRASVLCTTQHSMPRGCVNHHACMHAKGCTASEDTEGVGDKQRTTTTVRVLPKAVAWHSVQPVCSPAS